MKYIIPQDKLDKVIFKYLDLNLYGLVKTNAHNYHGIILGFTNQSLLVKAAEMKYLLINNEDYGFLRAYNFKRIRYNSIDLRSLGTSHDTLFDTIDFDAIWQKNKAKDI